MDLKNILLSENTKGFITMIPLIRHFGIDVRKEIRSVVARGCVWEDGTVQKIREHGVMKIFHIQNVVVVTQLDMFVNTH